MKITQNCIFLEIKKIAVETCTHSWKHSIIIAQWVEALVVKKTSVTEDVA